MENLAYRIKLHFPHLFRVMEKVARRITIIRFGSRLKKARQQAVIKGTLKTESAVMRPLEATDVNTLYQFLADQPTQHMQYFQPHGFDHSTLQQVLGSDAFLNYGLFVGERIVGYALLKISPTGSAFIGLLVAPAYTGMGIGTFFVRFLYWQALLAGLRARSTISRHNYASLASHRSVSDFSIVSELPNGYLLIEFPPSDLTPPKLNL